MYYHGPLMSLGPLFQASGHWPALVVSESLYLKLSVECRSCRIRII